MAVERGLQAVTAVRGISKRESGDCSCAQTSSLDVGARLAAACSSKLALEPVRRCRHDVSQTRPPCVGLAVFAAFLWHFEPSVHRQTFDGIAECQSFMVGQKTDHVAMHSASETMVETLVVVHGEAWGLFIVEWAAGLPLAPGADQLHRQIGRASCRERVCQYV